jgi:catechol 2,3-dioxygenase-like lactoylglutathione lyase family enzyme
MVKREAPQSELRAEFPRLAHLLSAYFHQDWDADGTPDEVIETFIRDQWPYEIAALRLELTTLLGGGLSDPDLERLYREELGAEFDPTADGISVREWLEHVRELLAKAPATKFTVAVPIIPARDPTASATWYRDHLGFEVVHSAPDYAIVERDDVGVHLWGPSGIEPEESNTMFRIRVVGIAELYEHCRAKKITHPNAPLEAKPWGAREFAVVDRDGNLLTFFER